MIKSYFGLSKAPFVIDKDTILLPQQKRCFDILKVHSQQGGLCVILGEPGNGKSVIKNHITTHNTRDWITPVINRSLHTWPNILRLLCQAFGLESHGANHKCENRLRKIKRLALVLSLRVNHPIPFSIWPNKGKG